MVLIQLWSDLDKYGLLRIDTNILNSGDLETIEEIAKDAYSNETDNSEEVWEELSREINARLGYTSERAFIDENIYL